MSKDESRSVSNRLKRFERKRDRTNLSYDPSEEDRHRFPAREVDPWEDQREEREVPQEVLRGEAK